MRTPLRPAAPRPLAALVALLTMLAGLTLVGTAPAVAVDATPPGNLTPASGLQAGIPTLSWSRVAGATSYDVQVANGAFSSATFVSTSTRNHSYVLTRALPTGPISWRVRVSGSSDASWATASFTSTTAAIPSAIGPADGSQLQQPGSPPVLSWSDVPGAAAYTVQVTTDVNFADPDSISTLYTNGLTSVAVGLQKPATYYWRVRGDVGSGVQTDWSTPRSYTTLGLPAAQLTSPPDDINNAITDVVLDWQPVPGATSYDIQISNDRNFVSSVTAVNTLTSTRYSPATNLANDQYYWRVRPVDAAGNRIDWSVVPIWKFKRTWPDQPQLLYPADAAASVGDPFYYQWTPVPHASLYRVQLSRDVAFNNIVGTCDTVHTTLTMGSGQGGGCFPAAYGGYYWRVLAFDAPSYTQTVTISSPKRSYSYVPATVLPLTPASGATVAVPTVHWQPVAGAMYYQVAIVNSANPGNAIYDNTYATSYTPTNLADGDYRWSVTTVAADGHVGATLVPEAQPTFRLTRPTSAAPSSTPDPQPVAAGYRFPTLKWSRQSGATSYKIYLKTRIAQGYSLLNGDWTFPAADDRGTGWLAPGDYDFYVVGYNGGAILGRGAEGHFTISSLPSVDASTYVAGLNGNAVTGNGGTTRDTCDARLPSSCQNLRQTPVLSWKDPDPNVGLYKLIISNDAELTHPLNGYGGLSVSSTLWTSNAAMPDGDAGSAYFYEVLPCTSQDVCNEPFVAQNAFNKLSRAVTLTSPPVSTPTTGTPVSDDVVLSWDDYLTTLGTADSTGDPDTATPLDAPATTEAYTYEVQVADNPNFQSLYVDTEVDQTTFSLYYNTYPEGLVYWRVRARDGSGNYLPWSTSRSFQKTSPVPVLVSPSDNATPQRGDLPFSWKPLAFARSYDIEVYRKDGNAPSPANLAASGSSTLVAGTLDRPLAASTTPYQWRVRRRDAAGRAGGWSALREFTVRGQAPTLLSPLTGSPKVSPVDASFSWSVVPTAVYYRWELKPGAGNSSNGYSVSTPALAFAPTEILPGGSWSWTVTAVDREGRDLATSPASTFTVVDSVLAVTPTQINGSGKVGTQLTLVAGTPTWNTDAVGPVTTTLQWQRNGNPISGATDGSYILVPADLGQSVTLVATGRAAGYKDGTSTSNAFTGTSGVAVQSTAKPVLSGTPIVGNEITATSGSWSIPPTSYTYEWQRGTTDTTFVAVANPNGNSNRYTLTNADAGSKVRVKVTAAATGYDPGVDYSTSLDVAQSKLAPSPGSKPVISGNAVVGSQLNASPGAWPAAPTFSYQWLRDTQPIEGATGQGYLVVAADSGHQLAVQVVARQTGYGTSDPVSSDPVQVARQGLTPTAAPTISGNATVRGVVTVNPGTWPGNPTFTFTWTRDGAAINGATGRDYTVVPADAGHLLAARVVASAAGYEPGTATTGALRIAKQGSQTTLSIPLPKLSSKARAKVTVTVVVNGVVDPSGSVDVYDGAVKIATASLKPGGTGEVVIRLPKLKKGKHLMSAEYVGNDSTAGSKAPAKKVKVVVAKKKKR